MNNSENYVRLQTQTYFLINEFTRAMQEKGNAQKSCALQRAVITNMRSFVPALSTLKAASIKSENHSTHGNAVSIEHDIHAFTTEGLVSLLRKAQLNANPYCESPTEKELFEFLHELFDK